MQALQEGGRCRQTLPFRNILDREAVMLKVGESSCDDKSSHGIRA
jgi:hypothetical protein